VYGAAVAVPTTGCPIVASTEYVPPDALPPPPAITDLVIVNVPPDCAVTFADIANNAIERTAIDLIFRMLTAHLVF
jgi:hypothetical protein